MPKSKWIGCVLGVTIAMSSVLIETTDAAASCSDGDGSRLQSVAKDFSDSKKLVEESAAASDPVLVVRIVGKRPDSLEEKDFKDCKSEYDAHLLKLKPSYDRMVSVIPHLPEKFASPEFEKLKDLSLKLGKTHVALIDAKKFSEETGAQKDAARSDAIGKFIESPKFIAVKEQLEKEGFQLEINTRFMDFRNILHNGDVPISGIYFVLKDLKTDVEVQAPVNDASEVHATYLGDPYVMALEKTSWHCATHYHFDLNSNIDGYFGEIERLRKEKMKKLRDESAQSK